MNFDAILTAFINVLTPLNLIGLIFGVAVGIIIGALPGLSVNMGIALLFPLTFSFQGIGGILMLLGVYCGAIYGGSISAILLKTPGTPASAATTIDGYPMAVKYGQPGRALGLSTFSSTFGGIFSAICLMISSPLLASRGAAVLQAGVLRPGHLWHLHYHLRLLRLRPQGPDGRRDRTYHLHYRHRRDERPDAHDLRHHLPAGRSLLCPRADRPVRFLPGAGLHRGLLQRDLCQA